MVGSGGKRTGVLGRLRDKRDRRRHPNLLPVDLITPDQLVPQPHELVLRNGTPDTIAGWKALADGLLTNQSCVFHRNLEISSRYAWIYKFLPACFKWAGMAAFASHHVRLALFPLRLDRDRTGYVDIPHSLGRRKVLLMTDVNTIRETNNAIFDDIFWVHLAYATRRRRDRMSPRSLASGAPLRCRPLRLRGDRPRTPCLGGPDSVGGGSTGSRGSHLGGQRPAPRARAARLGATQPRWPLVRVRQALLDRLGPELRGAWTARRGVLLHLVLLLRAHTRHPASHGSAGVAADHPLRRPLALDRDVHRSPLPKTRRSHALGRRQSAPHLRRSARLRVEPLCPTATDGDAAGRLPTNDHGSW